MSYSRPGCDAAPKRSWSHAWYVWPIERCFALLSMTRRGKTCGGIPLVRRLTNSRTQSVQAPHSPAEHGSEKDATDRAALHPAGILLEALAD